MPVDFHGYELLLLRRLQNDPVLCAEWLAKLQKKIVDDDYDLGVNILLFFMDCKQNTMNKISFFVLKCLIKKMAF